MAKITTVSELGSRGRFSRSKSGQRYPEDIEKESGVKDAFKITQAVHRLGQTHEKFQSASLDKSGLISDKFSSKYFDELLKEHDSKTDDELAQDLKNQEPALATLRRELGIAKVKHSASEIADRLEAGNGPFLVGAWHTSVIDALYNELDERGWNCDVLDGRTSSTKKKLLQDEFNAGEIDVLIGQIAAMGVSLNLQQGSNKIIVVEEDWSPSVMDQFYARLHRIGQKNHVHVDTFISDTKLDKAVGRISSAKQRSHHQLLSQKED